MDLQPVRVTEGRPLGVFFYNVYREAKLVIWYVSYTPCDKSKPSDFVFVIQEVCDEKWLVGPEGEEEAAAAAAAGEESAFERGTHTILWEQKLRGHNEWIAALEGRRGGEVFVFEEDAASKVLVGLRVKGRDDEGGGGYSPESCLRNAYFYSQSRQEFLTAPGGEGHGERAESEREKPLLWFRDMTDNMSVSEVDIVIRTAGGVYSCPCADEGDGGEVEGDGEAEGLAGELSKNKRKRVSRLLITDLFKPVDCQVAWRGRSFKLRVVLPEFEVMWANPESLWNCCLTGFFRALLAKMTLGFEGLPPARLYVFPAACREGARFPPYFPGFPFFRVLFTPMRKITAGWLAGDNRPHAGILLHHPSLFRSPEGDRVLCPRLSRSEMAKLRGERGGRGGGAGGSCWPLMAVELNGEMCEDERYDLIRVDGDHALLTLDMAPAVCALLNAYPEDAVTFLAWVAEFGSRDLVAAATSAYNRLLTRAVMWASGAGFVWAAIHKSRLLLVSAETELPSEEALESDLRASLGDALPAAGAGVISHYGREAASVFLLWKEDQLLVGKTSDLPELEDRQRSSWRGSLTAALCLTLTEEPADPLGILRALVPTYHRNRYDVGYWLVERGMLGSRPASRPPLPLDCLSPAQYLLVKDGGCVCWHEALTVPLDVDFMAYLSETLSCVCAALPDGGGGGRGEGGGSEGRNQTHRGLEELESILSLL
ncbi:helicase-primase subunit [Equid gammaherpesvirus 5]|uniref:Helicase-primase subunit n=1 Tax=Equid gammaherpesvirus 5 TaxID=10371 RepID=A0A0B4Q621_9GAMA|nr:helicase-primase subunit [Equid gammaherpesvirus 5]AIU39565.1 helicase-primase subunit [Equid gammaherpesvirus 5]APT43375.1 helicase-primase subunit [Equid gammaherpesvirus 5]